MNSKGIDAFLAKHGAQAQNMSHAQLMERLVSPIPQGPGSMRPPEPAEPPPPWRRMQLAPTPKGRPPPCPRPPVQVTAVPADTAASGAGTALPADAQAAGTGTALPAGAQAAGTRTALPADEQAAGTGTAVPAGAQAAGAGTTAAIPVHFVREDRSRSPPERAELMDEVIGALQAARRSSDLNRREALIQLGVHREDRGGQNRNLWRNWYMGKGPHPRAVLAARAAAEKAAGAKAAKAGAKAPKPPTKPPPAKPREHPPPPPPLAPRDTGLLSVACTCN